MNQRWFNPFLTDLGYIYENSPHRRKLFELLVICKALGNSSWKLTCSPRSPERGWRRSFELKLMGSDIGNLCIDLHGLRSFCSRKWNNGWTLASASALDLGAPPHSPPQAIACQPLTTEIHPDVLRKRRRFINFRTNRLTVPWEIITHTISSRIAGNLAQD